MQNGRKKIKLEKKKKKEKREKKKKQNQRDQKFLYKKKGHRAASVNCLRFYTSHNAVQWSINKLTTCKWTLND